MIQGLMEMGMTEYEAKVYLALLEEHPATGYQVSKSAGIPRSMVYEALGRLECRGAVYKSEEEKSALYRPVPPEELLALHLRRTERNLDRLRETLGPLYSDRSDRRIWAFQGREQALAQARRMLEQASRELMLVLTDADVAALRPHLALAAERELTLGVLLTGDATLELGQAASVARHPKRETELHHMLETLIVVRDEQEVLIASGHAATQGTTTCDPNLALLARQFVWMELFSQRIFRTLGPDLLARLAPADRRILEEAL